MWCRNLSAGLILWSVFTTQGRAQDEPDKSAERLKGAIAVWDSLEVGAAAKHETEHLLIVAPKGLDRRLKEIGGNLEKHYAPAFKALQAKPEELWSGKLIVYLFSERDHFTSFVRRIEKRRLEENESGSQQVDREHPHAAAGPPRAKNEPGLEVQAAMQVAAALLQKKAGAEVPLPEWLPAGFSRATVWRTLPADKSTASDRKLARTFIAARKRTAPEVWNNMVDSEESGVLRASLADYLAYGPGAAKFSAFVKGFKPGENQESRTTEQAMESAGLDVKAIEARWGAWALGSGK
jgi:hypothetical protein